MDAFVRLYIYNAKMDAFVRFYILVESKHLAATQNSIKQSTRDNATTLEDIRIQMAMLHHVYFRV